MAENLKNLDKAEGSVKTRARKGRGIASGAGKTSGRGMRGQKCRSGYSREPWREGGQTPLYRRLPKRQVNTRVNRKEYSIINLSDIQSLAEAGHKEISLLVLEEAGFIKKALPYGLKVLGAGELSSAVTVKANKFSESAKEAIEKAGGKAIEV
ncbi:MAG: 50S ribosomal protein L15 [Candidatus Caenarcaniphilales bacterium]|nr:50S ribosomal protein L15 [Candidatus Caenarcaniphilales bacterium]